eukprot:scaffold409346_cov46-Prasinocladus_malaysianus.AAC.1
MSTLSPAHQPAHGVADERDVRQRLPVGLHHQPDLPGHPLPARVYARKGLLLAVGPGGVEAH